MECSCGRSIPSSLITKILEGTIERIRCNVLSGGCGKIWTKAQIESVMVHVPPVRAGVPMTLEQAAAIVTANLDDGVVCPCCDQFAKRYKRKLNSGMARTLIWLVREFEKQNDWINVPSKAPSYVLRSNEHGKLPWWGLVINRPNEDDPTRKYSGDWKPTPKGVDFVYERIKVPARVVLYNNCHEGFDGKDISIKGALGKKFDYAELMRAD